nr:hypothetical protein [uncultured Mediterranean phage uvMED]
MTNGNDFLKYKDNFINDKKKLSIVINIFCLFPGKFKDCARGYTQASARQLLYIYTWIISTDTQTPSQLYRNTFLFYFFSNPLHMVYGLFRHRRF